jgi:hypothetical protein
VVFAGFYLEALEAGLRGEPVSGRGLPRSPQRTTRARCLSLRPVLLRLAARGFGVTLPPGS